MTNTRKNIKILQVSLTLTVGGLETIVMELSKRLIGKRFSIEVLCLQDVDPDNESELNELRIPLHVLKKKNPFDLDFINRLSTLIRKNKIDIVHAHSGCFFYAALSSKIAGAKGFIYTAHGMPIFTDLKAHLEDTIAGLFTDYIISVSHEINIFLQKWHCFWKPRFKVIINGVDTNKFRPISSYYNKKKLLSKYTLPRDTAIIGSVGRLAPEKNYKMLINAFASLKNECNKKVHLVFVGSGSEEKKLVALAKHLGVIEDVTFLGFQSEVYEILSLMNIFVLSSLTEGTSISLLEAQACGVPAVVTDVGGNGFVIKDGWNGYLCPVNDVYYMERRILKILNSINKATVMGQRSIERIRSFFSMESMVDSYATVYNTLLEKKENA